MAEITGFTTNIGLITSHGSYGHNVMACEKFLPLKNSPEVDTK